MNIQELLDYFNRQETDVMTSLPSMAFSRIPPKPSEESPDYDLVGWRLDPTMAKSIRFLGDVPHRSDKYKLPQGPSYSDESIYNSPLFPGGIWENIGEGLWNFKPSEQNRRTHSIDQLIDYFSNKERKGTTLQLPGGRFIEGSM
jgi:hypothetical protein